MFPYKTTVVYRIGNVDRHSWPIRASRVAGAADRYSRRACGGGATACDTGSDTGIIRRHFGLCAMAGSAFVSSSDVTHARGLDGISWFAVSPWRHRHRPSIFRYELMVHTGRSEERRV